MIITIMLECMWNDNEAETALRRMQVKEDLEQTRLENNAKDVDKKTPESEATPQPLKRRPGVVVFDSF
jgi:hypothetical protein